LEEEPPLRSGAPTPSSRRVRASSRTVPRPNASQGRASHIDSDREATRSCSLLKRPIRFTHRLATPPEETTRADPRVPSLLDGGTGEDVESDPFRFLSDGGRSRRARSFRRLSVTRPDPTPARSPTPPDLRGSGSYSVPSASAWRKRGEIVESERLHVSSPALPSDRAEVSPNLRVLMFASAAGGDALKQDDTGHWGRGGVG